MDEDIELQLELEDELEDYFELTNRQSRQPQKMIVNSKGLFNIERLQRERAQRIKQNVVQR